MTGLMSWTVRAWATVFATMFVITAAADLVMPWPSYHFVWLDVGRWAAFAAVMTAFAAVCDSARR